jgi:dTMP kinase
MNAATGKFITFEGGEGAGKSTQTIRLRARLDEAGLNVLTTREPGGSQRAEAIREVLLSGKAKPFGPLAEAVLLYVARDSHLEATIRPALARGTWVVCDRFADSTRAYQGAAGGVPLSVLSALDHVIVGETKPDLTIILDLPPEEGLHRAKARAEEAGSAGLDRFEEMNITFHRNLRQEFLDIAAAEPVRCVVIDAAEAADEVGDKVWAAVRQRFGLAGN